MPRLAICRGGPADGLVYDLDALDRDAADRLVASLSSDTLDLDALETMLADGRAYAVDYVDSGDVDEKGRAVYVPAAF